MGGTLRRQEYEEYPEKTSRVFQERRQKAIKVCREFGSEQSPNIGTSVCRAIALSSLREWCLKNSENVSLSVRPRSEQRRYSRSERIYESSAIGSGRRGLDFGQRQSGVECGVFFRCSYRLLLVVAEGSKYHALAVGSCSDYAEGEFVGPPVVVLLLFLLS